MTHIGLAKRIERRTFNLNNINGIVEALTSCGERLDSQNFLSFWGTRLRKKRKRKGNRRDSKETFDEVRSVRTSTSYDL